MGLLTDIAKMVREIAPRALTDGTNILGTVSNPMVIAYPNGVPGAPEAIDADGALSPSVTSILTVSGTMAFTLADGSFAGQRKRIFCAAAGSTPHGVVTPDTASGFTTLDFTTALGLIDLEWTVSGWVIVGKVGTVVVA